MALQGRRMNRVLFFVELVILRLTDDARVVKMTRIGAHVVYL